MSNEHDIEAAKSPKEHLEGYGDFAEFIASDAPLSIYRRYDSLAARNLLYLEAEIQLLEFQLRDIDQVDFHTVNNGPEVEKAETDAAARCWEELIKQAANGQERAARRLNLINKLRDLMKQYGERL